MPGLPPKFASALEAETADAELEYATRAERVPYHPLLFAAAVSPELCVPILIQKVAFAFCAQARNACREGCWTPADVRSAVETELPAICERYFARERGACSSEEISRALTIYLQGIRLDHRWKQHLSELRALAKGFEVARTQPSDPPCMDSSHALQISEQPKKNGCGGRPPGKRVDAAKLRQFRGDVSQDALAETCGLSLDTISRAENGKALTKNTIQKIAGGLTKVLKRAVSEDEFIILPQ